eukprot:TRINITY_DN65436_c0_g2_i1.p1 TRINITY_DN65436_c0_g2~~TRINITY_DN65436_c0_g2_i1.p1  ORF type:complete len:822 (+),score=173.26 TRINITY_DN65436_c0_g2_i1:113-2578(+)
MGRESDLVAAQAPLLRAREANGGKCGAFGGPKVTCADGFAPAGSTIKLDRPDAGVTGVDDILLQERVNVADSTHAELLAWLRAEVVSRLERIDNKLNDATFHRGISKGSSETACSLSRGSDDGNHGSADNSRAPSKEVQNGRVESKELPLRLPLRLVGGLDCMPPQHLPKPKLPDEVVGSKAPSRQVSAVSLLQESSQDGSFTITAVDLQAEEARVSSKDVMRLSTPREGEQDQMAETSQAMKFFGGRINGSVCSGTSLGKLGDQRCVSEGDPSSDGGDSIMRRISEHTRQAEVRKCLGSDVLGKVVRDLEAFLDDPESSDGAAIYAKILPCFATCTVLVTLVQTIRPTPPIRPIMAATIETVFDLIFLLEILIRFLVAGSKKRWFHHPQNIIDLIVPMPLVLRLSCGYPILDDEDGLVWLVLYCITPQVRLLKTLRGFQSFNLLIHSVARVYVDCLPAMLMLGFIILFFATLVFAVEPRDNVPDFATAIWLIVVSMTTVGYGDLTPASTSGYLIIGFLISFSVFIIAVPLGIIGQAVCDVWKNRDSILVQRWARLRLEAWGLTPHDIPALFQAFDADGNGELTYSEFRQMLKEMDIKLADARTLTLFESFDKDGSGLIDATEFNQKIFPEVFHKAIEIGNSTDAAARGEELRDATDATCSTDKAIVSLIRDELAKANEASRMRRLLERKARDNAQKNEMQHRLSLLKNSEGYNAGPTVYGNPESSQLPYATLADGSLGSGLGLDAGEQSPAEQAWRRSLEADEKRRQASKASFGSASFGSLGMGSPRQQQLPMVNMNKWSPELEGPLHPWSSRIRSTSSK